MLKIKVANNQSLFDIAIKLTGSCTNAIAIARHNQLELTSKLEAGSTIDIPESLDNNKEIQEYYSANNICPATGLLNIHIDITLGCQGIGCWFIENDFKVS